MAAGPLFLGSMAVARRAGRVFARRPGHDSARRRRDPPTYGFGLEQSFSAVLHAASKCLGQAGLALNEVHGITACLAFAGASEPTQLSAAQRHKHPFGKALFTTDAHAACIGAHGERDGGGYRRGHRLDRLGGVERKIHTASVAGASRSPTKGAAPGLAARRCAASSGRLTGASPGHHCCASLFADFADNPHAIVRWTQTATPRDFGSFAPRVFDHAAAAIRSVSN